MEWKAPVPWTKYMWERPKYVKAFPIHSLVPRLVQTDNRRVISSLRALSQLRTSLQIDLKIWYRMTFICIDKYTSLDKGNCDPVGISKYGCFPWTIWLLPFWFSYGYSGGSYTSKNCHFTLTGITIPTIRICRPIYHIQISRHVEMPFFIFAWCC